MRVGFSFGENQDLVKLTGTTTFAKEAMASVAARHRLADGGHLEIDGAIQREPENPVDPMAVAALVEGDRDGRESAPAYTEHAAIIHRKLGQRDEEIAVLKRWLRLCPAGQRDGSGIGQRLAKLDG